MQESAHQREALETQVHTELDHLKARARSELDLATHAEDALRAQVGTQQREVSQWTSKADRLLLLQGEAASNRSLYENLYAKLQESQLVTGLRTSRVAFIDAASVPTTPSSPKKRVSIGAGLLLGLLLGLVAALGREFPRRFIAYNAGRRSFVSIRGGDHPAFQQQNSSGCLDRRGATVSCRRGVSRASFQGLSKRAGRQSRTGCAGRKRASGRG